jgi:RimJ/RimL family protein N-acetyltransferase
MRFEFTHSEEALEFLREEIGLDLHGQDLERDDRWLFVVARNDHDAVVGVLVLEWKTAFDAHLSIAVADQRCLFVTSLHKLLWRTVFARTVRVTILIDAENSKLEHTVRKMGFVYEGMLRRGLDGWRDALVFGMLAQDCRWLKTRPRAPQPAPIEDFEQRVTH